MTKIIKILFFLGAVIIQSCSPIMMTNEPPEGSSPEYAQGWREGCDTAKDTYVNDYYRVMHTFEQDPSMMGSQEYRRAWNDAYTYCFFHLQNWVRYNL